MSDYWKEVEAISKQPSSPSATQILVPTNEALIRKTKTGAQWPAALAAISVANLALAYFEAPIRFGYGLASTEVLFEFGRAIAPWLMYAALVLDAALVGAAFYLGGQAKNFRIWAFVTLLALLVADTGILVWFAWITGSNRIATMLIHLLAFAFIWDGMRAAKLYVKRKKDGDA